MQVDLKMLIANRIDYLLGWPTQPIVAQKLNRLPNDFVFYNLREDQNYLYIGISCGKCETGKKVIAQVNALLRRPEILAEVLSYLQEWTVLTRQYKELYTDTIKNRNQNPLVVHMAYPE